MPDDIYRKEIRQVLVKLDSPITINDITALYSLDVWEDKIVVADNSVESSRRIQDPRLYWGVTKDQLIMVFNNEANNPSTSQERKDIVNSFIEQLQNEG